jgi:uncharacterized protein (TIGR03437 family)
VVGIDNAGEILVLYNDASGVTHGALRTADGSAYTLIEVPGAASTTATGISAAGLIVGYGLDANRVAHPFILSADRKTFTTFDAPGAPVAVNDKGEVLLSKPEAGGLSSGLLRSADGSTYTKIDTGAASTIVGGINNSGEIAGWFKVSGSYSDSHGFTRAGDGTYHVLDLPGTLQGTFLVAVNNQRQLLAGYPYGSVLNPDGSSLALDPAQAQSPAAINDNGVVAGTVISSAESHGFVTNGFLAVPTGDTQPAIRSLRGVESASAFGALSTIAPGTWIEIYGVNLAPRTRQWSAVDFVGNTAPTSLDDVKVTVNGQPAFVSYISPGQVNAQVPSDLTPGAVFVTVTNGAGTSAPYKTTIAVTEPGLISTVANEINENISIFLPDGSVAHTVKPGDTIVLYGIGFGATIPDVAAGQIATRPDRLQGLFEVSFDADDPLTGNVISSSGQVTYAGHVPGTVGLYQFNVVVPPKQWSQPYGAVVTCFFSGSALPSPFLKGILSVVP